MRPLPLITVGALMLLAAAIGWWSRGDEAPGDREAPRACVAVEPALVDFDASPIDGLWLRRVEVRNCGDAALVIAEPTFDDGPFMQVGPLDDAALEPGDSRVMTVGFAPDTIGHYEGAARVGADGVATVTLALRGDGVVAHECPPLVTRLGDGQVPATPRSGLCAPLAAPALFEGTGLVVEPAGATPDDGPSI